ncbi:glycoside hydrolase family 104 protein [Burkholderia dolosa]|jgi:muramidase (phage lysozyme)|uniref:glycoside hydrolase family 24 protein n=1 Tax=Burkholderia dolosa TaxID=152500 RepID=UPI001591E1FE|nr:glycoside hydrolase family 104 protein [Burkholderia dolosa]MBR8302481.1 glycoside hydrolase family 104 protein [Burkholderia dolosa]MBR8456635.1 glycoside hydrolase family 104 protein [Burkholderia dolosa]
MARISAEQAGGKNRIAFLDMIAHSEGTVHDPATKDDGYDVLVTGVNGPQRFSSYADHPNILVTINHNGLKSTAAGRYQLLHRFWQPYKTILKLPDFSPVSQDLVALQQIRERGALQYIDEGMFDEAVRACSNIWASLPGNDYGQRQNSVAVLLTAYQAAGGTATATA